MAHDHPARIAWSILILLAVPIFLLLVSYRIVFGGFVADLFYCSLQCLFLADIGVNFLSRVKIGHLRLDSARDIARRYLRTWFAVDLLAALPLELIVTALFGGIPTEAGLLRGFYALQCLSLIKLLKVGRIFRELEESLRIIPAQRRLISVAYWLAMALHLMALGWILIGAGERSGPAFDRYLRALYWVTTTIATIGYGDYTPNHGRNVEIAYTILVELFGVGMFSYIVANVSSLVASLDLAKSHFRRRLDEVNAYLRAQRIPAELQDRVRDYYSFLWSRQRGVSANEVLEGIPRSLSQEILMYLNRELVSKVELFRGAEELFIRESVQLLKPRVFLPGEYIIRQGEYGDSMYFLTAGELLVLVDGKEVAKLGPGSPFGETALMEHLHRNASVVSREYGSGYQLSKDDFDALRARYPEFDRRIRAVAEGRKGSETEPRR